MTRRPLLSCIFFLLLHTTSADAQGLEFGLLAGVNTPDLTGEFLWYRTLDSESRFTIGGFVQTHLSTHVSLRGEVQYVSNRFVHDGPATMHDPGLGAPTVQDLELKLDLDLVEIPLLFVYDGPIVRGYAGPYVSFRTGCSAEGQVARTSAPDIPITNCDRFFPEGFSLSNSGLHLSDTDWGFVGGFGVHRHFGRFDVGADFRYQFGIPDINEHPFADVETLLDTAIRRRGWMVSIDAGFQVL